jgi:hypothetical protein
MIVYRVERRVKDYAIYRSGDGGALVRGDDPVFLHRIVDMLNELDKDYSVCLIAPVGTDRP